MVRPLMLAMSANAVNLFADRLFLAHYSDVAIQGSLPGGIMSWLFIVLGMNIVAYSGTFVAQYWGAGSKRDAAAAYGQGLLLSCALTPLLLAFIWPGNMILRAVGHSSDVLATEIEYFDILMLGSPFIAFGAVMSGYFAGKGMTKLVGTANIIGNLANILLDWVLIFGKCGAPRMGIAGAGIATGVSQFIPCLIFAGAMIGDQQLRGKRLLAALRPRWKLLRDIIYYGIPSGFIAFLDTLTFSAFVMLTGRLDAMSFAVSNVCFSINHLSFAPLMGLHQGATVLAGQYQGAGDSAAAERSAWSTLAVAWLFVAAFALFVIFFGDWMINIFHDSNSSFNGNEFIPLGKVLLYILLAWEFLDATNLSLEGTLKGAGDTRFVMLIITLANLLVWMPMVILIVMYKPTIIAMWGTMPFYCLTCTALLMPRFIRGKWKAIQLIAPNKHRATL